MADLSRNLLVLPGGRILYTPYFIAVTQVSWKVTSMERDPAYSRHSLYVYFGTGEYLEILYIRKGPHADNLLNSSWIDVRPLHRTPYYFRVGNLYKERKIRQFILTLLRQNRLQEIQLKSVANPILATLYIP